MGNFNSEGVPNLKNNNIDFHELLNEKSLSINLSIEDGQKKIEVFRGEANRISDILQTYGYPKIGELIGGDIYEGEQTLKW